MYEEVLHEIGLSQNEAKVYEAMLSTGEASVQEMVKTLIPILSNRLDIQVLIGFVNKNGISYVR